MHYRQCVRKVSIQHESFDSFFYISISFFIAIVWYFISIYTVCKSTTGAGTATPPSNVGSSTVEKEGQAA